MSDTNLRWTFSDIAKEPNNIGLGYLNMVKSIEDRMVTIAPGARFAPIIREIFKGTLMLNGGYYARSGNEAIEKGDADLISFGVLFLANPDLPERFKKNAQLNSADVATFYTGEEKGYIDYPELGY